jgi:LPXTG-motif cell wall-anchored protein
MWTDFTPGDSPDGGFELVLHSLTNGTPATVHVRGVSSDGVPGPAGSVTGTPFKPIGAPTHVAFSVSGAVVTISWDAPATTGTYPLAGYQAFLYYSNGESGGLAFECDTDVTVHTCKAPAPPGPSYSGGVNAVDSADNAGDPSNQLVIGKTAPPASVPASSGKLAVPSGPGGTGSVVKGQKVTLHGTGYAPNSLVSVLIYSTPQVLTTVMTDSSGSFTVQVTVPAGLPDGHHTLVAAGADPSGNMRYLTLPVTVTAGSAELAYTGASVLTPALAGLGALVLGGGLLVVSRRRTAR